MNIPAKILHLDSNHPLLMQKLADAGFINDTDFTSDENSIIPKIGDYEGIVIRSRFRLDAQILQHAHKLRFIARVGAGLENIDADYAREKNITLIAAPEGNRNAVGEHALSLLLALFNKIVTADREVRAGQWNREKNRGVELDGKTVGIIGYGNTGKAFARKLRGFDVNVICYDILPGVGDSNAKQVPLDELYLNADVISLHVPWTADTDGMINLGFIEACAKPFWLINTSRGKNVITDDLVDGLRSGKVLGCGLDVLEYEKSSFEHLFDDGKIPEGFNYLLNAENVVLSPHVAGWTRESNLRLAEVIADKIIKLYNPLPDSPGSKPRVTGIGGFFFKSEKSKDLVSWYGRHLGLNTDQYGCTFWWKDKEGNDCSTQWSPFGADTTYFEPSSKQFMQNFRVADLDHLLKQLSEEGVEIIGEPQAFDYGKFAWIMDPEGNKIELWEPVDKAFQ